MNMLSSSGPVTFSLEDMYHALLTADVICVDIICSLLSPLGPKWLTSLSGVVWSEPMTHVYAMEWCGIGQGSLVWHLMCWAQQLCSERKKPQTLRQWRLSEPFLNLQVVHVVLMYVLSPLGVMPRNSPKFAVLTAKQVSTCFCTSESCASFSAFLCFHTHFFFSHHVIHFPSLASWNLIFFLLLHRYLCVER